MNIVVPIEYGIEFTLNLIDKFVQDIELKLIVIDFRLMDIWLKAEFGLDEPDACRRIINYALNHIEIITSATHYVIEINPTINYSGTDIRLITLLKTINYGNRYFKGIPIIVNECERLNTNLGNLYGEYELLGAVV